MNVKSLGRLSLILVLCLWSWAGPAAWADDASEEATVHFRAQGLPTPQQTDVSALANRAVLRAFLEQRPHVSIEPFVMPDVTSGGSMDTGPLMAIAAGIPPHAIYVNFRQSSTYLSQGFLVPVEVLLARLLSDDPRVREYDEQGNWLADPSEEEIASALTAIRERVTDPAWPVVYRQDEAGAYDREHVWAVPTGTLVMALQYRKDLFAAAGLDPERGPEDWDELMEYARKLTVPERQQYGLSVAGGSALSWGVYSFLVSAGARAVAPGEDGNWQATYGTPEAAEAVEFFWRLANEPFERDGRTIRSAVYIGSSELKLMWTRGQVAMRFAYLDEELLGEINPQLVGIAPVPLGPTGERGSELNNRMLGIYSGATPAQQLAVMDYIWFVTSEEAQRLRTRIYIEHGYGQFVSPRLLEKFGYDRILRQVPEGWQQAFESAMSGGVPEPYGRNTQNIYRYLSRPIYQALETDYAGMSEDARLDHIQGLLKESAEEVNLKVLGNIPPEQMRQRRIVGSIVIVVLTLIFTSGLVHVWRYFSRVSAPFAEQRTWRSFAYGYLLLFPAMGLTIFWLYVPLTWGSAIAFSDYRIILDNAWVGVDNFANVLYDDRFWTSLGRTLWFVALMIGLGFWPPILLAILLDEVPTATLKYVFRTIFYLPAIISGVIIMFLWKQLYDPSEYGVLNQLLLSLNGLPAVIATLLKWVLAGMWVTLIVTLYMLPIKLDELAWGVKVGLFAAALLFTGVTLWPLYTGFQAAGLTGTIAPATSLIGAFELEPLGWISSPELAMLCVVVPLIWAGSGPGCLLYLAALKTVPEDLYEAADIDGAGNFQKLFYITLPRLKYLITIQFIAAVIAAFKGGTDYILALTGGGPGDATNILGLEIFMRTFTELEFGLGAAMAWLLGAMLIAFTAYQLKMLANAEFKTANRS